LLQAVDRDLITSHHLTRGKYRARGKIEGKSFISLTNKNSDEKYMKAFREIGMEGVLLSVAREGGLGIVRICRSKTAAITGGNDSPDLHHRRG